MLQLNYTCHCRNQHIDSRVSTFTWSRWNMTLQSSCHFENVRKNEKSYHIGNLNLDLELFLQIISLQNVLAITSTNFCSTIKLTGISMQLKQQREPSFLLSTQLLVRCTVCLNILNNKHEQYILIFKFKLFGEKERRREETKSDWLTDKVWLTNWPSLTD